MGKEGVGPGGINSATDFAVLSSHVRVANEGE